MSEDDLVRLRHVRDAAHDIWTFRQGRGRADLDSDRQFRFAVVKCLEIIGEAAGRVSPAGRAELPNLPWPRMVGMRHRTVHRYYEIDLDILWATIDNDIEPLMGTLDRHLGDVGP